jgi:hypothetical protein
LNEDEELTRVSDMAEILLGGWIQSAKTARTEKLAGQREMLAQRQVSGDNSARA